MSQHGLFVCLRTAQGLQLVDALGPGRRIDLPAAEDFAFAGNQLWTLRGSVLEQTRLATGRVMLRHDLPRAGRALIAGSQAVVVVTDGAAIVVDEHSLRDLDVSAAFPAGANRLAIVHADHVKLVEGNRCIARVRAPAVAEVYPLFGGRLLALHGRDGDRDIWCVVRDDGARVHQIVCPHARRWAVAGESGAALGLVANAQWQRVELRYGTVSARGELGFAADELEISADGHYLALAQHAPDSPHVIHLPTAEIMTMPMPIATASVPVEPPLFVERAMPDPETTTRSRRRPARVRPRPPADRGRGSAHSPYAARRAPDDLPVVMARAQGTDVAQAPRAWRDSCVSARAGVRLAVPELLPTRSRR